MLVADEDHLLLVERADAELWTPGAFASSDESLRPNHADRFGNDDLGTPRRPRPGPSADRSASNRSTTAGECDSDERAPTTVYRPS
ncbi:hypothetical protein [Haloarchaeobius iranensis]|uniref:Uncharacterized protein n=1 Tax=Haloarchaeobius iranensis TaxID=996166 RepID=A0A1H0AR38_9EURY|nr:hypothetical protein [Haloarchaeobius iranensis]SDN35835.1 hypothetical protein SAMN05192554_1296 [Haloarchaeobius iranensis]